MFNTIKRWLSNLYGKLTKPQALPMPFEISDDEILAAIRSVPCHYAQVGFGTKVEYKVGAGSYVELVDITDLELASPKITIAMYQPLRTTRYKQKKAGTGDAGQLKITMVHVAATLLTLTALLFDETLTWRITRSDGTSTEIHTGVIEEIGRTVGADEIDKMVITVAANGPITFA